MPSPTRAVSPIEHDFSHTWSIKGCALSHPPSSPMEHKMSNSQYDEKLAVIITDTANRVCNSITVEVDNVLPTVSISDDDGEHDDIIMNEDKASSFLDEAQSLYDRAGTVTMDDALLCVAAPYAETLFN